MLRGPSARLRVYDRLVADRAITIWKTGIDVRLRSATSRPTDHRHFGRKVDPIGVESEGHNVERL